MGVWAAWAKARGKTVCFLFRPRREGGAGAHIFMALSDSMHCCDMGASPHLLGSIIFYIIWIADWGWHGTLEAKRLRLNREIQASYTQRRVNSRFGSIEFNMLISDTAAPWKCIPFLKGKAIECKHLVPVLLDVMPDYIKIDGSRLDCPRLEGHMFQALSSLNDYYDLLDFRDADGRKPYFFKDAQVNAMRSSIKKVLLHYNALTVHFEAKKPPQHLFHQVSKFHTLYHVGYESEFQNPAWSVNYLNEEFQGRIATLCDAARHGITAGSRSRSIATKYCFGRSWDLSKKE